MVRVRITAFLALVLVVRSMKFVELIGSSPWYLLLVVCLSLSRCFCYYVKGILKNDVEFFDSLDLLFVARDLDLPDSVGLNSENCAM